MDEEMIIWSHSSYSCSTDWKRREIFGGVCPLIGTLG